MGIHQRQRTPFALMFLPQSHTITPNNVRIPLGATSTSLRSLVPSLCEGMSSRETLVSEADRNGGIMGEFINIYFFPPCVVIPGLALICSTVGFRLMLSFYISDVKREKMNWGSAREHIIRYSECNISLAAGN